MSDELSLTEQEQRVGELVRAVLGDRADQPFRPVAFYDATMDRIVVLTRDCSICEICVGLITLFEDNHPEPGEEKLVGFAVESVNAFCRVHGLSTIRVDLSRITDLFDTAIANGGVLGLIDFEKLLGQLDETVVELKAS